MLPKQAWKAYYQILYKLSYYEVFFSAISVSCLCKFPFFIVDLPNPPPRASHAHQRGLLSARQCSALLPLRFEHMFFLCASVKIDRHPKTLSKVWLTKTLHKNCAAIPRLPKVEGRQRQCELAYGLYAITICRPKAPNNLRWPSLARRFFFLFLRRRRETFDPIACRLAANNERSISRQDKLCWRGMCAISLFRVALPVSHCSCVRASTRPGNSRLRHKSSSGGGGGERRNWM